MKPIDLACPEKVPFSLFDLDCCQLDIHCLGAGTILMEDTKEQYTAW